LRKEFGLVLHQLWGIGLERFGDLRVQLLPGATQQAAMCRVLHQRVLEGIDGIGRLASLEHQLGGDKAAESGLQLVLGATGDGAKQTVGKLASYRRADLRHQPHRRQSVEPRQ